MLATLTAFLASCDILDTITAGHCLAPSGNASVNLTLHDVQLLQVTQLGTPDRDIPLIMGKPLQVRSIVTHDQGDRDLSVAGQLRITGYSGEMSIGSWTTEVGCIVGEPDPQSAAHTPVVNIPASGVRDDLRVLVELMDANGQLLAFRQLPDDALPALSLVDPPEFHIHFLPLAMGDSGIVAELDHPAAQAALELTMGVFPLRSSTVTIRDPPYHYLGPSGPDEGPSLLQELRELQLVEDSRSYYHAIVPEGEFFSNVGGQGYLGTPIAFSRMFFGNPVSTATVAHEIGHNFSLHHAACGTEGKDPDYPYADGIIGKFGFDSASGRLYPPGTPDLMSYCGPEWISDYHYLKTADFRAAEAEEATLQVASPGRIVVISGQVAADGTVELRPLLHSLGRAAPPAPGTWEVQLLDAAGSVLQRAPFTLAEVSHSEVRSFVFSLALADSVHQALGGVRIVDPDGNTVAVRTHAALGSQSLAQARLHISATRTGDGNVQVTWPPHRFETVLVLDPETGTVLARGNGGSLAVAFAGPEIEVLVSTGVRGERFRLPVTGR